MHYNIAADLCAITSLAGKGYSIPNILKKYDIIEAEGKAEAKRYKVVLTEKI